MMADARGFAADLFAPLGEWGRDAACRDAEPTLFDTVPRTESADDTVRRLRLATSVCAGCPVRAQCEAEARDNDLTGVWGGVLFGGYQGAPELNLVGHAHDSEWWYELRRRRREAKRVGAA